MDSSTHFAKARRIKQRSPALQACLCLSSRGPVGREAGLGRDGPALGAPSHPSLGTGGFCLLSSGVHRACDQGQKFSPGLRWGAGLSFAALGLELHFPICFLTRLRHSSSVN